ncbi:hypothetical protein FACI_IFERC00001G1463 [Ferroplasma acidarmanus Fer1]|jgi:hypothetical protein|uniref:Uncharacterized protein n=1 Tax=Ferroplasma acidarmanus Fer1 TaxID=333146 RepID=S0AQC5_FERAC|nr:hypothetical protein FACI_IFERC00001G1463 [Ferroplasma acidarmanus Fer1]
MYPDSTGNYITQLLYVLDLPKHRLMGVYLNKKGKYGIKFPAAFMEILYLLSLKIIHMDER